MKILSIFSALVLSTAFSTATASDSGSSYSTNRIILGGVSITDTSVADISVSVSTNNSRFCKNKKSASRHNIVTIHGITHTAATWQPLTDELMNSKTVCNVFSIDLPGHGDSTMPEGSIFGDMTFQVYANSIINTVARLQSIGFKTPTIFGFSHGGFLMQVVQQTLIDNGSSLREELGVKNVVFFSSSLPRPLNWEFSDSGFAASFITQFFIEDESLGTLVSISDELWQQFWFTNVAGVLVDGAPSLLTIKNDSYNTVESAAITSELFEVAPFVRPTLSEGIYSPYYRTKLTMLGFSNDIYITTDETASLYNFLTGDHKAKRLVIVDNDQAVHDYHISSPRDTYVQLKRHLKLQ